MKKTVLWRDMKGSFQDLPLRLMILVVVLAFAFSVNGQKISPSPDDLYEEAGEYMMAGDYQEALPVLLNLEEKGYTGANISFKIGECYLNLKGQKTKAIPFLKEASQKISVTYSGSSLNEAVAPLKSLLYLGISYRLNYDFVNALSSFKAYLNALDEKDTVNRSLVRYHIDRCQNATELIASPARFRCDTLPGNINTVFSNFNPLVSADEKQLFYMDQLKFYLALMKSVKQDTTWQKAENLTPAIRSDGDLVLTGISSDGTALLLSSYDPYMSGEIFIVEYRDGRWSEIRKLNGNINTQYNETHASFSPDGHYIYFTSDRKGGFGGLDVYRSERNAQGDWGVAENLGPLVNSPYSEETPFVTGNPLTLFFSSQGHYNMGGYDIFRSDLDLKQQWLPPVNLGFPINTTDDDLFFFPLGSGKVAYESRFAFKSSQSDIVRFNIISFGNPARYTIHGMVGLKAAPGYEPGDISVSFSDNLTNDKLSVQKPNPDGSFIQKLPSGSFEIEFAIKDSVLLRKKLEIPVYFPQDELILSTDLVMQSKITRNIFLMKDIQFAFNKSSLEDSSLQYLERLAELMSDYPRLQLSVRGFADALGIEIYNMKLSLARANTIAGFFKRNKSLSGRISVIAFGEQNPVAVNQNPDGSDNPSGRAYNRRVELVFDHIPDALIINRLNTVPVNLRIK
jgi:outer membrane protein OmpA-like peptidoglycan-associated protein